MKKQTAVIVGATGLIGSRLMEKLLSDAAFDVVRVLVRRPLASQNPKLEVQVVDFNNLEDFALKLGKGDCLFCCIGTTQKKMKGDKVAYRKIDFDIPVHAAQLAKAAGFTQYLLVSSVGADAKAKGFYLKLKGEVEEAITTIGFGSFHVFRPSFLLGVRNEVRLVEGIGKFVFKAVSALLIGNWRKYKAIDANDVAGAMVAAAKKGEQGVKVYYYDEMMGVY
ncbi:NAD(P)H-binding protein [Parasediminibacterium sp. JCM 36343]|uniref:NAD(P)H-binding protein n=1 Tax=Parasediminibacterium sp. JCM 36343 TaxID=3374279 RepID=UPI00397858CA